MLDREKVINCLTDIENIMIARQDICQREELQYWIELQEGVADAIAMLKEQEAVIPGIVQDLDGIYATCGICNAKLWKMIGVRFEVNPDEMPKFCPKCGRKVKWE